MTKLFNLPVPLFSESKLEYVKRAKANDPDCDIAAAERLWSENLNAQYAAWKTRVREREDQQ